jgi:hypothetical protein
MIYCLPLQGIASGNASSLRLSSSRGRTSLSRSTILRLSASSRVHDVYQWLQIVGKGPLSVQHGKVTLSLSGRVPHPVLERAVHGIQVIAKLASTQCAQTLIQG